MSAILDTLRSSDIIMLCLSAVLLLAAPIIVTWLNGGRSSSDHNPARVALMRTLNGLIIIAILIKAFLRVKFPEASQTMIVDVIQVLMTIYFTVLIIQVVHYLILRRFGKKRDSQNRLMYADTYSSRALSLFAGVFIAIIALVMCLKALGLNSWLEASGVIGIIKALGHLIY